MTDFYTFLFFKDISAIEVLLMHSSLRYKLTNPTSLTVLVACSSTGRDRCMISVVGCSISVGFQSL